MSKVDDYRETLNKIDDWDNYLRSTSGLSSRRGIPLAPVEATQGAQALSLRHGHGLRQAESTLDLV